MFGSISGPIFRRWMPYLGHYLGPVRALFLPNVVVVVDVDVVDIVVVVNVVVFVLVVTFSLSKIASLHNI